MRALVELALAVSEEERSSNDVSPMVQKALEKHRAEREEQASEDIVSLLRLIEEHKLDARRRIRSLKAELKRRVSELDDLDRRWAYAQKTNNFLPVLSYFNRVNPNDLSNPGDWDELTTVPQDFKVSK